jgi:hypothetical protein
MKIIIHVTIQGLHYVDEPTLKWFKGRVDVRSEIMLITDDSRSARDGWYCTVCRSLASKTQTLPDGLV